MYTTSFRCVLALSAQNPAPVLRAYTTGRPAAIARPHSRLCSLKQPAVESRHVALSPLRAVRADKASAETDTVLLELISQVTGTADTRHAEVLKQNSELGVVLNQGGDRVLRSKVVASIRDVSKGLLEREQEVRLLLLAALCGEHLLLLGPPGTAKSELSRRLSKLTGGKYFERLLTRFSVPEELFGPLSMKGLENDEYVRKTDGYLPTAEVAFIDEIFKANSAILNALLTLLNERLFDNGADRFEVPLLCLVGASNELPESEELEALYDRFLIRRQVSQVSSGQLHRLALLAAGRLAEANLGHLDHEDEATEDLTMDDFRHAASRACKAVDVPEAVIELLTGVRDYLQDKCEPPVYVSDRRFMKAVNMLQVAAFSDGRDMVTEYDCLLLEYVFGNRPDDAHKVRQYVLDTISSDPGLQQTELVFLGLFGRVCRIVAGGDLQELPEAQGEVHSLVELLTLRQAGLTATLGSEYPELRDTVWQSAGLVQGAVQSLTPQMTENKKKVEDLLREALVLEEALRQQDAPTGFLEKLMPKRFKQYQKGISSRA